MKTYRVYGLWTASKIIGEFEANSEEEAIAMAEDSDEAYASLCWHCTQEIELSDSAPYKFEAEEA
jgi:hypothetical protein